MKEYKKYNLTWCTKEFDRMNWYDAVEFAKTYKKGKWRLPTIKELLNLVDYSRANLAINSAIFTNANSSGYWSASSYAGNSDGAWDVNFKYGYSDYSNKYYSKHVRLVR